MVSPMAKCVFYSATVLHGGAAPGKQNDAAIMSESWQFILFTEEFFYLFSKNRANILIKKQSFKDIGWLL